VEESLKITEKAAIPVEGTAVTPEHYFGNTLGQASSFVWCMRIRLK
jgi:hypothetical protein